MLTDVSPLLFQNRQKPSVVRIFLKHAEGKCCRSKDRDNLVENFIVGFPSLAIRSRRARQLVRSCVSQSHNVAIGEDKIVKSKRSGSLVAVVKTVVRNQGMKQRSALLDHTGICVLTKSGLIP